MPYRCIIKPIASKSRERTFFSKEIAQNTGPRRSSRIPGTQQGQAKQDKGQPPKKDLKPTMVKINKLKAPLT
uniref:Uncharacterized protein n=1 Tax=Rhizophagus irregularis (strain DAOM 181602 / DAOM 197198 / MUCL 43194) TaxID=747089 RepID=U9SQ19_RHIID